MRLSLYETSRLLQDKETHQILLQDVLHHEDSLNKHKLALRPIIENYKPTEKQLKACQRLALDHDRLLERD